MSLISVDVSYLILISYLFEKSSKIISLNLISTFYQFSEDIFGQIKSFLISSAYSIKIFFVYYLSMWYDLKIKINLQKQV